MNIKDELLNQVTAGFNMNLIKKGAIGVGVGLFVLVGVFGVIVWVRLSKKKVTTNDTSPHIVIMSS